MENKFKISVFTFSIILLTTLCLVLFFHQPPYIPLFISYIFTFNIAYINKYLFSDLLKMSVNGIKRGINVMIILLLIGALVALWKQNGTLPALIYYSSKYLKPENLLIMSFLVTSVISMILGTAIGTASTIGIVIMGLSHGLGYPLPIVAGAIISGSFIGDRTSPLSGNVALLSDMGEISHHNVIKSLFITAIPVYIISALLYYIIGLNIHIPPHDSYLNLRDIILSSYKINPLLFISPFLIIVLAFLKVHTKTNLAIAVTISYIISILNGYSPLFSLKVALLGYSSNITEFKSIFSGGGMLSILPVIGVVSSATALSGILEGTGIIKSVFNKAKNIKNSSTAYIITMLLSTLMAIIACNQALAVILPSRIMFDTFHHLDIKKEYMTRAIADSGIVLAGIIPWNLAAMLPSLALGVKVTSYLPYAFLNLIFPIVSIIIIFIENKKEGLLSIKTKNQIQL